MEPQEQMCVIITCFLFDLSSWSVSACQCHNSAQQEKIPFLFFSFTLPLFPGMIPQNNYVNIIPCLRLCFLGTRSLKISLYSRATTSFSFFLHFHSVNVLPSLLFSPLSLFIQFSEDLLWMTKQIFSVQQHISLYDGFIFCFPFFLEFYQYYYS